MSNFGSAQRRQTRIQKNILELKQFCNKNVCFSLAISYDLKQPDLHQNVSELLKTLISISRKLVFKNRNYLQERVLTTPNLRLVKHMIAFIMI